MPDSVLISANHEIDERSADSHLLKKIVLSNYALSEPD